MDSVERKIEDVKGMIRKLRNITIFLQIAPFVYSSLYVTISALYLYGTYETTKLFDLIFYISPLVVAIFLIASKILGLCKWHKTACSLPLIPQAVNLIDYYLVELTEVEASVMIFVNAVMALLLLVAAYHVFISPTKL